MHLYLHETTDEHVFPFFSSAQNQTGITGTESAPKPFGFSSPPQKNHPAVLPQLPPAKVPVTSTHQSTITSTVSPSHPQLSVVDSSQGTENQDLLLPPSAFMSIGFQNTVIITRSLDRYQCAFAAKLSDSALAISFFFFKLGKTSNPGDVPLVPFHHFVAPVKDSSRYPGTVAALLLPVTIIKT